MAANESKGTPPGSVARRVALVASLLALSLVASALLAPRVSAIGQPGAGYAEASLTGAERFQVMGADYSVRTNLSFGPAETIRVNVSSNTVDWRDLAAGGGVHRLALARFDGVRVTTVLFAQAAGGPPFTYSASIDLSTLTFAADWFYLQILVDDTVNTFQAVSAVRIGAPAFPHLLETYADPDFAHPSDVFTPTSTVWVRLVGLPAADTDQWDLAAYVNGASAVNGPNTNFDNFQRTGAAYTFSIDLSPFAGNLNQGWAYTLNVRLAGGAFDAGKQIQIVSPTVSVSASSLAPTTARQGQTGVPMLELTLSLDAGWSALLAPAAFSLDRIRVTHTGSGPNADIAGVHLYDDVNGNGVVDGGDILLASATAVGGVTFPAWVGHAGVPMAALTSGGPLHLILTYDIAPAATVGDTDGVQVAAAADIGFEGTIAGVTGLPVSSTIVQIAGANVLTVTDDPGIAPASATQGQAGVAVDLLNVSTNGAAMVVSSIAVTLAGTGGVGDVASVSLHVDNGDGVYASAQDRVLGSAAAFTSGGVATFTGLAFPADSVGRSLWIVYDLSASATVGDRVGSSLPTNASVAASGGTVYGGTFPLASGLVRVAGPTLTLASRNLAPAQAIQGRMNLTMLELTLSVNFGQATVNGVRVDKRGTSALDSDVPLAKIWLDNGDGLFDMGDLLLGSQGFVGGTTVIGGLALTVSTTSPRTLFVSFDIAPTATVGVTVSARLATSGYVSTDASSTVDPDPFPVTSAAVLITAPGSGAYLTVGSVDMARLTPRVYRGAVGVLMEKLYLSVDQNSGTVTGMHVNKIGTSTLDADVAAVKLYRDADGNGNFGPADTLLASSTFVGGIAIFGNLNIVVPFNEPVMLYLVFDVSPSADVGRTLAVYLGNHANVVANATTTVDPNSFPIESSEVTIAAASIHGTVQDASGKPVANAAVAIPELNLTTTTDANGNYSFSGLPLGDWYVLARGTGYASGNRSTNLTATSPDGVVDFTLAATPTPIAPGTILAGIAGGLLALLVLGTLLFVVVRRRSRCPVCGKAKARDEEVCPECMSKGLHPPGAVPPKEPPSPPSVPPPLQPPSPPAPPETRGPAEGDL